MRYIPTIGIMVFAFMVGLMVGRHLTERNQDTTGAENVAYVKGYNDCREVNPIVHSCDVESSTRSEK